MDETLSLTWREVEWLRVFEDGVLIDLKGCELRGN
jgi:hypothetical protein